jgi:hypothetical protein
MNHCHLSANCAIPSEYRKAAETLFPAGWFTLEEGPDPAAAAGFADSLGVGAEYQRLLGVEKNTGQMREFLGHFQNNLDLLIQKTWVEKADEDRKEKLQDEIPPLMTLIVQENLQQALKEFGTILDELAYLFFGTQSGQDDFTEYAFRIDAQIGLFWWYGSQLGGLKRTGKNSTLNNESIWAILLIGICYLTNF